MTKIRNSTPATTPAGAPGLAQAATLQHAGECFGQLQAACEAAEARVYIAAGVAAEA